MKPTTDYWLSRRPKYNLDRILRLALRYFSVGGSERALSIIQIAIRHNHQDSCWLYERLMEFCDGHGINCEHMIQVTHRYPYHKIIKRYQFDDDRSNCFMRETLEAAEQGCDAAQCALGTRFTIEEDFKQAIYWHRQAAAQDNAYSCYVLSGMLRDGVSGLQADSVAAAKLCLRSSNLGSDIATWSYDYPTGEEIKLDYARLLARRYMRHGWDDSHEIIQIIKRSFAELHQDNAHKPHAIETLYAIGQELYEYELYYEKADKGACLKTNAQSDSAIKLYLQLNCKVRKVAVQTILVMLNLGVVKDIAKLIDRLVYASRSEAAWYSTA